jgi:hypothetical protein
VKWSIKTCAILVIIPLAIVGVLSVPWRHVVHRVEVTGLPGRYVEFVEDRSVLFHGKGYIVVFPDGGESKQPLPLSVSLEDLRRDSSAQYDGGILTVNSSRGRHMTISGWRP